MTGLREKQLLTLLRQTSRSFYLSVRLLPRQIRPTVALAYLIARATDTIADASRVAPQARLGLLAETAMALVQPAASGATHSDYGEVAVESTGPERQLLTQIPRLIGRFRQLPVEHQHLVSAVIQTIVRGQSLDLERFELTPGPGALQNSEELDDYTYLVAGSVGEFWTKLCYEEWPHYARIAQKELILLGVAFGQGLQLINVLRDLPVDLENGRCYLPLGEPPFALDSEKAGVEFRKWREIAFEKLALGWQYVESIRPLRIKFACALPILIGIRTLSLLKSAETLRPGLKISRREVYRLMIFSVLIAAVPTLAGPIFHWEQRRATGSRLPEAR